MRQKYPLTTQTKKVFIVIRKNKKIPKQLILEYLNTYFEEYAYIEHEKDIEPITKIIEGCHYHIIGNLKDDYSRDRLQTTLNHLVDFFHFENANGVEIDKYDNYVLGIQYLIHKNNPEKTQHKYSEIISNIDDETLSLYLTTDSGDIISFDMIYSVCYASHNIVEVIKGLGLKNYHKYRQTIKDIYDYVQLKKTKERLGTSMQDIDI